MGTESKKKKVFISYSHKDLHWKDRLVKHLSVLVSEGLIEIWTYDAIPIGKEYSSEIKKNLNISDIYILLVSPNFLVSKYKLEHEIPLILQRREKFGAVIIPIKIELCSWTEVKWLSKIQAFPSRGEPLSFYKESQIEYLLYQFVSIIKEMLNSEQNWPDFNNFQEKEGVTENELASSNNKNLNDDTSKNKKRTSTSKNNKVDKKDINNKNKDESSQIQFETSDIPNICDRNNVPVIGAKELAKELSELIKHQISDEAIMIGIFGQWGRGKTYLMEQIWKQFEEAKDNSFTRVDFHAWKFQDTPASWAYLYEAFSNKYFELPEKPGILNRDLNQTLRFRKRKIINFVNLIKLNLKTQGIKPIVFFLFYLGIGILGFMRANQLKNDMIIFFSYLIYCGLGIFLLKPVKNIFDTALHYKKNAIQLFKKYTKKKEYANLLGLQKEIQDELKNLLKTWINEKDLLKNKRILLVVDDLDRCSEERLIQVVDSLRVMLEDKEISKRVIALVAVDDRILARAIHCKYKGIIEASNGLEHISIETLAQEYLDKLFLVGVKLNPLNKKEKEDILESIVCGKLKPKSTNLSPGLNPNDELGREQTEGKLTSEVKIDISSNPLKMEQQNLERYYKMTSELLEHRELKRIKPKLHEFFKKYEGVAKDEIGFKAILDKVEIITETEKSLIMKICQFIPELNGDEHERLQEILPCLENATPRSIRILYYQYILAKRLLENPFLIYYNGSLKSFFEIDKNLIFDLLYLIYCNRSAEKRKILYNELSMSSLESSDKMSEKISTEDMKTKSIIDRLNQLEPEIKMGLLRTIEIVVAY